MDRLYIRLGSIHWMATVFSLILMSALNRRKNADEEGRRKSELALLQCQCMNAPQLYKDSKPDSMDTITLDTNFNLLVME